MAGLLEPVVVTDLLEQCNKFWPSVLWTTMHVDAAAEIAGRHMANRIERAIRVEGISEDVSLRCTKQVLVATMKGTEKTLESIHALARFVWQLCEGYPEESVEKVGKELLNCFENETLTLMYRDNVWQPEWQEAMAVRDAPDAPPLDRCMLKLDQMGAIVGHPIHPNCKVKMWINADRQILDRISFADLIMNAPEFQPLVKLRVVAVTSRLMRVWPSLEEWQGLWRAQCPAAMERLAEELGEADASTFALLPLHPLTEALVRDLYAQSFVAGDMRVLEHVVIDSFPTLSFRTLVPQGAFKDLHIKVGVPMLASGLLRYMSPVEAWGSRCVGPVVKQMSFPEQLGVQLEEFGAHLRFGNGEEHTFAQARFMSTLLRQSPAVFERPQHSYTPLCALFVPGKADDASDSLWVEHWRRHGITEGCAWLLRYVQTASRAMITPFLQYGMAIEAHGQNTCLEFRVDGDLSRMICKEIGGGFWWDHERIEHLPSSFHFREQLPDNQDLCQPTAKCIALLRQTLLRLHLWPLLDIASRYFGIDLQELRTILWQTIGDVALEVTQVDGDSLPVAEFELYRVSLLEGLTQEIGQLKALLRMRFAQTTQEIYVPSRE